MMVSSCVLSAMTSRGAAQRGRGPSGYVSHPIRTPRPGFSELSDCFWRVFSVTAGFRRILRKWVVISGLVVAQLAN
jgi:hypothetical protein